MNFCRTFLALSFLGTFPLLAQQQMHLDVKSQFGSFVEDDFPFFCQTLDARDFGENPEETNLTPRGIIVKLGQGHFGCFDPDLLRWSLVWKANEAGEYLTMDGMGPGSYRLPNRKAPAGQESLPKPIGGAVWATPALPGWWVGAKPETRDPRDRGDSEEGEIGLGPMSAGVGRFSGIQLIQQGVRLEYTIGQTKISDYLAVVDSKLIRRVRIEPHGEKLWLRGNGDPTHSWTEVMPSSEVQTLIFGDAAEPRLDTPSTDSIVKDLPKKRWTEVVEIELKQSEGNSPFLFDDLGIPVPNPWKRNVRLSGFDFFPDGRAAFCTFDGDVWIVSGLVEGSSTATWSRFASGLHEPKTVCIVNDQIYVSDRNGIVRLHDADRNGEADWYENFSNVVAQTAETREFAMDMVAAADGGFYLAKGGQIGSTRGKHNGSIVKVSSDGLFYEVIATGLRQPYIGYDAETGILTSSDQQGHWKPATPIYRIEEGKYYGFQPAKLKDKAVHPAPIAPPEVWIPHFINQSGAAQVWMKGPAKMGALNGSLVHIGYNRPEIFRVYLDEDRKQGAVVPILSGFPAGILKGRLHPLDGRLYLTGFEIWGTSADRISGLFRVRPTGKPSWIPKQVEAGERGILLSFDQKLSPDLVADLGRYSIDRWNYQQTHNYGSGNFKLDGKPGQESVPVASARLSTDEKTLFLGLLDMRPSHSLRVTYRLPVPESTQVESAYLTVHSLDKIDLRERGFESDEVDLSPKESLTSTAIKIEPTAKLGKEVAIRYGCIACHATGESGIPVPAAVGIDGAQIAVGPPWIGLWKSHRNFTDGSFIKAVDETYLRESILDPGRRVAEGFETEKTGVGMPSYLGVLKDHEIESVILYIQTLAKKPERK